MIRILIADDHALIREGLRKVFRREDDIEVVAEATDAGEAVARVREQDIDVAVLDFNMPGRSGLDALAQIRALKPRLPVLFLSMMPERDVAMRVFKAGAAGFVSKESAADEIVNAVRRVASGRKYVSPEVAEQLATGIGAPEQAPAARRLVRPRVPDRAPDRRRPGHAAGRRDLVAERQHHRDLSSAHPRQTGVAFGRRDHPLRDRAPARRLSIEQARVPVAQPRVTDSVTRLSMFP